METLRETIAALADKSEAGEPLTEVKETVVETPVETPVESVETKPETDGRTAGRARDEKGRLLPGKAEVKAEPVVEIPHPPKPSSWKKDYDEHWGKLDPKVAEYINQRESEYAKGVSTYKTEWEQAKPLLEAVAPYQQEIQRMGKSPAQVVAMLAQTHDRIVKANPMEKIQLFAKLAQDYGVPLQALLDPNFAQQWQQFQTTQQPQNQESPEQVTRRVFAELKAQEATHEFGTRKDASGNPMYPHFEKVRGKMAQLLESGLAEDLEGAYTKCVRLDDELWKTEQESKEKALEAKRLEDQRKVVQAAKSNAISPKSSTPAKESAGAQKGLRSTYESAYEQFTGGRV